MLETCKNLLSKIENHGFVAYAVGGFPRDIYLNKDSVDIDICTNATPKDLKLIFKGVMIPNPQYGSVKIIYKKVHFEITTFRKEIKYENNRYPVKIEYINDLLEDLKRRDFIINTLCMDKNGEFIDLLDAKVDIDTRIIRTVGNPNKKLREDALRTLRALRFATTLNFEIDKATLKAIKKNAKYLKNLSYARKKEELDRIFSNSNYLCGVKLFKDLKLDKHLELKNFTKLKKTDSLMGIWAQLDCLDKYPFTNNEKEMINKIKELSKKDVLNPLNLYHYGLYISLVVGEINNIDRKVITSKYNELAIKSKKEIVLGAKDVCKLLNREPGSWLKDILNQIEISIVKNELKNEKKEINKFVSSQNIP